MNIEAVAEEVMDEFTDAIAPEWAGEAAVCWEAAKNVADDAGCDADSVWRESYAEQYVPTTDGEFEWAMRKRSKVLREVELLTKQRDHEVQVLLELFNKRIRKVEVEGAFWTEMVERGVRATEPDGKGKRTVRTIVGTAYVTRRKTMHLPEWDADKLVAFGRELGVEPRVTVAPDKTAIKAALEIAETDDGLVVINKATGEPVDAVSAEYAETVVIK